MNIIGCVAVKTGCWQAAIGYSPGLREEWFAGRLLLSTGRQTGDFIHSVYGTSGVTSSKKKQTTHSERVRLM